ncbi:MAG: hypothetical protein FWH35_07010 [Treponema sp.]|nr:hypothetical protein [Treponema sp.]
MAFLNAGFGLAAPPCTSKAARLEKSPYLKAIIDVLMFISTDYILIIAGLRQEKHLPKAPEMFLSKDLPTPYLHYLACFHQK